jgi:transposase
LIALSIRSIWPISASKASSPQQQAGLPTTPSVLLKLYIYGYLNRVQSSRRLEREAGRNLEVMWLLGRLVPDDKVIADFRKNNGRAIRKVCASFVNLCRQMGLLAKASVAIDGSKTVAGRASALSRNQDPSRTSDRHHSRLLLNEAHWQQRIYVDRASA